MLEKNFFLEKLKGGKPVLGTFVINPSIESVDIISSSGIDFLVVDSEHGPISYETAQKMAITCESRNVSPVMRVGNIDLCQIQNALDIGMHGIQVPNINTIQDAANVIRFSKYPPKGIRGFSPFTRAGGYSIKNAKSLTLESNKNIATVLNIEGIDAVRNFDEILTIDEVDIYFVGLFDLSKSLGIPGDTGNPLVLDKLIEIVYKVNKAGKFAGTIATSLDQINYFLNMGIKYLIYSVDCDVLRSAYAEIKNEFENIL
tara:strand:- start:49 stop:822 length:774 start_codon:yes stop_codon:yes gene_type:complete